MGARGRLAEIELNGARLYYELRGEGDGMVLIHGSWDDHHAFDAVAPVLARRFRVTAVVERLQAAAPGAERRLFDGAGHPVDLTHPAEYAAAIEEFAGTR